MCKNTPDGCGMTVILYILYSYGHTLPAGYTDILLRCVEMRVSIMPGVRRPMPWVVNWEEPTDDSSDITATPRLDRTCRD